MGGGHSRSLQNFRLVQPFSIKNPAVRVDPYPVFRWLHEHDPVHRDANDDWFFTRHADVIAILRDHHRFSNNPQRATARPPYQAGALATLSSSGPVSMLFMDPPDHTRIRGLVSRAFTPKVIEALRPLVEQRVDELLDAVAKNGGMDAMSEYAYPLPVMVICEMLGIPEEDRSGFHDWSGKASRLLDPIDDVDELEAAFAAAGNFVQYFLGLFERRRAQPGDDLVSALLAVEEEGDRLAPDELMATCILLLIAGHETTMNLIGNGTLALLRHPDQLELLRDDSSLDRRATDELLRYDSPVQYDGRNAREDGEFAGVTVNQGEHVLLGIAAANRDPDVFEDPDILDLTRNAATHVAFGAGIHHCLGAALARLEGQIAIPRLIRRFPQMKLAVDEPEWREHMVLRGLRALPVEW